jgi:hypothetical protein
LATATGAPSPAAQAIRPPELAQPSFCRHRERPCLPSFISIGRKLSRITYFTIISVPETTSTRLDRVLAQLRLYEHPLLNFSARSKGDGVEIIIQFKDASMPVHTYYFDLHPRDLDHPQFEWSFQRQLYDALHDYFVEMFIRTPQDRADRRRKEL